MASKVTGLVEPVIAGGEAWGPIFSGKTARCYRAMRHANAAAVPLWRNGKVKGPADVLGGERLAGRSRPRPASADIAGGACSASQRAARGPAFTGKAAARLSRACAMDEFRPWANPPISYGIMVCPRYGPV